VAGPLPKIGRSQLAQIPVPEATSTHKPVPHHVIFEALAETLSFRHIRVVNEEYAVSFDGMKMFGVLDLETQMEGCRFSIGIRNSHDKSLRLGLTAGLRVFVCSNMAFSGEFHSCPGEAYEELQPDRHACSGCGPDQRGFEPMRRQVEEWRQAQITDERAKLIHTPRLLMANWKRQGLCSPKSTGSTSSRSTRNSRHGRCGARRTRSLARSRNWIRFPSSRPRRNWALSCLTCLRNPPTHLLFVMR